MRHEIVEYFRIEQLGAVCSLKATEEDLIVFSCQHR